MSTNLDALLTEQAALPAAQRAARLAGDGDALIRLQEREKQLITLIDVAQAKGRADQLRAEIAALDGQTGALEDAQRQTHEAAQAAMTAIDDAKKAVVAAQDAFRRAQGEAWLANSRLTGHRQQLADKRRELDRLVGEAPAPPPAPRPPYVRTSEPLTPENTPPFARPQPPDEPRRSYVIDTDGTRRPHDGRPIVTERRA